MFLEYHGFQPCCSILDAVSVCINVLDGMQCLLVLDPSHQAGLAAALQT